MNSVGGIMQRSAASVSRPSLFQTTCRISSLKQSSVVRAQKSSTGGSRLLGNLQGTLLGSGAFFASAPAWAEDAADAFTSATEAVVETTTGPATDDPVITIMFTVAVAALTVVTLGVAYLSLVSWNDSRQENEDRLRTGGKAAKAATSAPKPVSSAFSSDEDEPRPKKKNPKAASTSKGFGKQ